MSNGSIVNATHCAFVKQHVTGSSIRLTNVRTREIDRHQTNAAMQNGKIVNRATCSFQHINKMKPCEKGLREHRCQAVQIKTEEAKVREVKRHK